MTIKQEINLVRDMHGDKPVSAVEPLRQVSQRTGMEKLAEQLVDLRMWMQIDLESLEAEIHILVRVSR